MGGLPLTRRSLLVGGASTAAAVLLLIAAMARCYAAPRKHGSPRSTRPRPSVSGHQRVRTMSHDEEEEEDGGAGGDGSGGSGGSGGGGGGTSDTNAGAEGALVGRRVQIHGLTTRADMNGLEGVATSYSQHRGRYIVMSAGGVETAIKPSNLRAV